MDPHIFRALILAGPLGKAHKEALLRCQTVHGMELFVSRGVFPRKIGQNLSSQVGHVLAQRELAVNVNVIHHNVLGVLIGNTLRTLFEFLAVILGPPFAQVAMGVELAGGERNRGPPCPLDSPRSGRRSESKGKGCHCQVRPH